MKVKEVIAELQKLDQERNIWISYDGWDDDDRSYTHGIYDPIPNNTVKKSPMVRVCMEYMRYEDVKVGDYLIEIG